MFETAGGNLGNISKGLEPVSFQIKLERIYCGNFFQREEKEENYEFIVSNFSDLFSTKSLSTLIKTNLAQNRRNFNRKLYHKVTGGAFSFPRQDIA